MREAQLSLHTMCFILPLKTNPSEKRVENSKKETLISKTEIVSDAPAIIAKFPPRDYAKRSSFENLQFKTDNRPQNNTQSSILSSSLNWHFCQHLRVAFYHHSRNFHTFYSFIVAQIHPKTDSRQLFTFFIFIFYIVTSFLLSRSPKM